ncbi:MAG: hypothetical protein ACLTSZ_20150 [Lachnospiraceae bacterium]
MVSPYGESEVFRKTEATWKDYAGAGCNSNFIFRSVDGQELPAAAQQKFIRWQSISHRRALMQTE